MAMLLIASFTFTAIRSQLLDPFSHNNINTSLIIVLANFSINYTAIITSISFTSHRWTEITRVNTNILVDNPVGYFDFLEAATLLADYY